MPTAFVLSGGGARAATQVGMLRALIERGVRPDMVIGASAGAVNGAWYALHPTRLSELQDVWLSLTTRSVFPGTPAHYAYNFIRYGHVHSIRGWARTLEGHFGGARFEQAEIPLTVITVRLSDGQVVHFEEGPVSPVLRATTAVPGVFAPQWIGNELHVDGAVIEYLPIPTAIRKSATTIYALDCSDLPPGGGQRGITMDRAGQIASAAWVRMVAEHARSRGIDVHLLKPVLGPLYDGRDFRHSRRLIDVGYEHAIRYLDCASRSDGDEGSLIAGSIALGRRPVHE